MVPPLILRVLNLFLLEWVPVMLIANGEHPDVHFETQAKKQIKAKNRFGGLKIGGYHVENCVSVDCGQKKNLILVRKSCFGQF